MEGKTMIPFSEKTKDSIPVVTAEEMERVYKELRTPYKWGPVIKRENFFNDCATIFKQEGRWYMMYTGIEPNGKNMGYDTYLAVSEDLLHWEEKGKVLERGGTGFDSCQRDGGFSLLETDWNGDFSIHSYKGKYYATYIGGALAGYETPPLQIGLAWCEDPTKAQLWETKKEPILATTDSDVRWFEDFTLYKSYIIEDKEESLGYPFLMYYNCKGNKMPERICMAVSNDMVHWERYGEDPVVDNGDTIGNFISGDPQVFKMGDLWVMNYFIAMNKDGKCTAYDTFAVSKDLVYWTKWEGSPLIEPSEAWDNLFAHKPFLVKEKGIVYHFYCACNDKGERFLALATSKNLQVGE